MSTRPDQFSTGADPVASALAGLARAHGATLRVNLDPAYVVAADPAPTRRVALVSGGGSGHEPLHTGFVGRGGLDAAIPGQVFASPHNQQIFAGARAAARPGGVLLVVKNYTGDVINFGIAAERLRAEGIDVETVLVDDDLATENEAAETGRRGTGATVVVEKVLAAAADGGASLAELADLGRRVVAASRSLAVASRAHTAPGGTGPAFELAPGQLEYGVGIHGERAVSTVDRPGSAEVVDRMLEELLAHVPATATGYGVLVNGLGAVTGLELFSVLDHVVGRLGERGLTTAAALAGTYVAALDMRGFSLTLTALEPDWVAHLAAPTATPALPSAEPVGTAVPATATDATADAGEVTGRAVADDPFLTALGRRVAAAKPELTRLDQVTGDGDFGDNLDGGTRTALASRVPGDEPQPGLRAAEQAFLDHVGGSSGPLFGLLFQNLRTGLSGGSGVEAVRVGLRSAAEAVQRVGGARPGDRTMADTLHAAVTSTGGPAELLRAAVDGAAATAGMLPRRGRASYLGERALGTPDPGAVGVAIVLAALVETLDPSAAVDLPERWS
ncbi:dihydroxyacetone kinase subunit DhaK [Kineococcus radiotolerans]|uniref:Glycerone kinase n=1 Tax=Kineococcus radiotolerans (strain ATCC BAA-149 / DSM 14245 / SRS30216) TaxID=266940 RepID=A6WF74_KINRD|nr:dihydroxyacetone kinase subunit DhaK [Kineococcus radiotolerans]ABS05463.1 Glycerone kinase [Kineococcus radiotolerans SRS30216 = ATCC BAA-149]